MPDWTAGLDHDAIEEKVYADTLSNMGLDSSDDLDADEREIVDNYVDMLVEAQTGVFANESGDDRDLSWDGPLAMWLDMEGIRPIMEGVDVGDTGETT